VTIGAVLAERRGERGLSIEQVAAATRIRAQHLRALEADEPMQLAAPVYAKGYLRTYASYLGLDPEPLLQVLRSPVQQPGRALGLGTIAGRPRVVLTAPTIAALGLVLLAGAFAFYAWRQIEADQRPAVTVPDGQQQQAAIPPATPLPTPSPQPRPIVLGVRVTDAVWLNVIVDGKSEYTDSGKILPAGSVVYFTGADIKITSGKAAATLITIDGHALGALGTGVATREFSSQTSP
jgi:transcriptional regulator with XRE-family HTH domain